MDLGIVGLIVLYVIGFLALIATALIARSKAATLWASAAVLLGTAAVTLPMQWFPNPTDEGLELYFRARFALPLAVALVFGITAVSFLAAVLVARNDEVRRLRYVVREAGVFVGMLAAAQGIWIAAWFSTPLSIVFGVMMVAAYLVAVRVLLRPNATWPYAFGPLAVTVIYALVGIAVFGGPA